MPSKSPRVSRRHGLIVAFRNPDWAAVMANLRCLHHDTQVLINGGVVLIDGVTPEDLHETTHLLATSLGAPAGWLHETEVAS